MVDITAEMVTGVIGINKGDVYAGICYKSGIMYQVLHCCVKVSGIDHSRKEGVTQFQWLGSKACFHILGKNTMVVYGTCGVGNLVDREQKNSL